MKKLLAILFFIFLSNNIVKAESYYKDFVVTDKFILGLTTNGKLKLFDKSNGKRIQREINNASEILLLVTDQNGDVVIADKGKSIKRYNEKNSSWELISKYKENIYGILFDSKNLCYLITDMGIEDVKTHKFYFSNRSLNHQIHYKNKWGKHYCYYLDKMDRIWLGYGYGEWGGDLFVFATIDKRFLIPTLDSFVIELWPIKSFFEDGKSVYLSSGLQHMTTSGIIIRFDNLKAHQLIISDSHWNQPSGKDSTRYATKGEYIGPATFNKFNNSIYFYSQNGIFRGDTTRNLSKIENWVVILKTKLHWKRGQPDAVGSPMNVLKITVIDKSKFAFLSQNDGIGYYDGDTLRMLK